MALPTTDLGMAAIQTEFGGSNPIALSEYYGVNANVASSGTIRMASFLGISALVVQVQNRSLYSNAVHSGNVSSIHHSNGQWEGAATASGGTASGSGTYNWLNSGSASSYDIRATKANGSNPTFSAGWANNTWINMNAQRYFRFTSSVTAILSCNVTVEFRYNSNGTVITSGNHELYLDVKK